MPKKEVTLQDLNDIAQQVFAKGEELEKMKGKEK